MYDITDDRGIAAVGEEQGELRGTGSMLLRVLVCKSDRFGGRWYRRNASCRLRKEAATANLEGRSAHWSCVP